ncbi:sensor histidine kinase [Clostridium chrysemydis]|uniref:sensor histidine kinase n=1 Tax=Clostridium chrysemydis TaxID=2665504 RepID=UPI003F2A2B05
MYNQNMGKRYQSFKKRLIISFVLVAICPFLVLGIYNLIYIYKSTEKEIKKFTISSIKTSAESINNSMSGFNNMVDYIASNDEIVDILNKKEEKGTASFKDIQKIYNLTSTLISTMPIKMPIHIISKDGLSIYSSTDYYKPIYKDTYGDFYKILDEDENRVHQKIYRRFDSELDCDVVLISGKAIVNKDKKIIGYVVIEILEKYFNQYINDITFFNDSNVYVTDINNRVIVDRNHIENVGKNLENLVNKDDIKYVSSNKNKKFNVISTFPKRDMYLELFKNIKIFMFLTTILLVVAFLVIYKLSKRISKPVHEMNEVIKEVENGNRNKRVEYFGEDELGELCLKFNNMIDEINRLIEEDYNKKILIKTAEFNALKAQVNPHFLYNALGTINWMVKLSEKDKVIKMINALSKLFRYSCRNSEEEVFIKEELKAIDNYLYIQKIRYEDKLNITYHIDKNIENKKIVRLTLQPLVENAIVHGFSNKKGEWNLDISGEIIDNKIIFKIKDNGVGIGNSTHKGEGIGIDNVDSRIKIQYGDEYGIKFESLEGYTVFIVSIPLREEEYEESPFS